MKDKLFFLIIIFYNINICYSQSSDLQALPDEHRNFQIQFYKIWQENDNRSDIFTDEIQFDQRKNFLHFRIVKDSEGKLISIAFYYKNLKIAPFVNNDGIWFHFIKYYYDDKNRLNKKVFYRETGEPQAQYLFEYNSKNQLVKLEKQIYNLNPYREKEYKPDYFILFDYHNNGKLRIKGRFDKNTNPEEKYIYDEQERIIRYERFYFNTKILFYYITFSYDGQNNVKIQTVYNIDGVLIEVPSIEEQRRYETLLETRYPRPGRRGPLEQNQQPEQNP